MVIIGAMALRSLPVAQYPQLTPPTVMVSASYPGADATTISRAVGVPIEQAVNGVEGMLYMSSSSSEGSYSLTITFEQGTDADEAAVKVENRVHQASTTLPAAVLDQGVNVATRQSDNLLFLALESSEADADPLYLTNYAQLNIVDPLSRVAGVGGVSAFGGGEYSMRIWLDPQALRQRSLTPADIAQAIRSHNLEVEGGSVGAPPGNSDADFQFTLTASGVLSGARQFEDIAVKSSETGVVRLRDVARVELGSSSYSGEGKLNGRGVALIGVQQLPGANALDVAKGALKEMERLSRYFPAGMSYRVILNSTDYVEASIENVVWTFVLTTLIVMAVIALFLQNWRAVVIPMLTIPVSLLGTFALMKLLGFSLNTLTLFGLVLAIAIVVDDAIVVVEDCSRLVSREGLSGRDAATKAMKELSGPVVGEVLVLLSVFVPTAFVSGITGELYKQFALTIATATALSGFNALTLTPALCALLLRPDSGKGKGKERWFGWFNRLFSGLTRGYSRAVGYLLRHPYLALGLLAAILGGGYLLYESRPTSFIPQEDMGYFITSVQLPPNASQERTAAVIDPLVERITSLPGVKYAMSSAGMSFGEGSGSNVGSIFVVLEPWGERGRGESVERTMAKVDSLAREYPQAEIYSLNPPAIPGLGMTSGLQMQLLDINNLGADELKRAIEAIKQAAASDSRIGSVNSMFEGEVAQYRIKLDEHKMDLMGLTPQAVYDALGSYMGGGYVNDFVVFDRIFQVTLQGRGEARREPDDLLRLSVVNGSGQAVPLSSVATVEPAMGVGSVDRYNMYTTASLTATPARGVSSSQALEAMEEIVSEAVGNSFSYAWTGIAYQETEAGTTVSFVFAFAIIMTLLVLAAQYESLTSPPAVVLIMPVAMLGTALGTLWSGTAVSIYTQIGLILLLGMGAKNAILIVQYAMDYERGGAESEQAAREAGEVRLRPIVMTALAFILGVMPMLFAQGAGANSQREIGSAIVWGMSAAMVVVPLFVPPLWMMLRRLGGKKSPDPKPTAG